MSTSDASPTPPRARLGWWFILTLGFLVMLVTMFYTVENWRGKRAWERCRRELEAKGEQLDWDAYIPANVPGDQNVFKAPWMTDWFVKQPYAPMPPGPLAPPLGVSRNTPPGQALPPGPVLLAEVRVIATNSPLPRPDAAAVLPLNDPATPTAFLRTVLSNYAFGPVSCTLVRRAPDPSSPMQLTLVAETTPSLQVLTNVLLSGPGASYLRLQDLSANTFRVWLHPDSSACLAADYLAWSDQYQGVFENLRTALARPQARMDGDYEHPYLMPVINYVHVRDVAQTLAQRAQCHLLLDQPDAALEDLRLLHGLSRLLETKPTVLVSAMINVTVSGMYAGVVGDGLRLQAWREPQLAALQQQLSEKHLLLALRQALLTETAAGARTLEPANSGRVADLYQYGRSGVSVLERIKAGTPPLKLAPPGWAFQNRANLVYARRALLECMDPAGQFIRVPQLEATQRRLMAQCSRFSPYTFLMALMLPNYSKATLTAAFNQTKVTEAWVACALERYRLRHGEYPAGLEALVPEFAPALPHDVISGAPLVYRRTSVGFLLYSVGWNQTDEGGQRGLMLTNADWPWP